MCRAARGTRKLAQESSGPGDALEARDTRVSGARSGTDIDRSGPRPLHRVSVLPYSRRMVRKSLLGSVGFVLALLAACSEGTNEGRSSNGTGGNAGTGGNGAGKSGGSGTAGSGVSGSSSQGGATGSGGRAGTSNTSGASGNEGGGDGGSDDGGITDAGPEDAPSDATEPPTCLGRGEMCGVDGGGTCCENLGCRAGKCCVPNGTYSNCISGADCCSGHCILNQCTCVPRGFSCSGAGQCCSGYACVNGTCICPPDIRGC